MKAKSLKNAGNISILITYAGEKEYVLECVQSVIANKQIEEIIICVDSSVLTEEIAENQLQESINLISSKMIKNRILYSNIQGPAALRNLGVRAANSEIILPIDADDLISQDYVEKIMDIFTDPFKSEIGIVYGQAEFFGNASGIWELPDFKIESMVLENMIYSCAAFRKTDWEAVGGYDEQLIYGQEDWDFWLKILGIQRKVFRIKGGTTFYYRIRTGSRSEKFSGMWEQVIWTYNKICQNNKALMAENVLPIYNRRINLELQNSHLISVSQNFIKSLVKKLPRSLEIRIKRIMRKR